MLNSFAFYFSKSGLGISILNRLDGFQSSLVEIIAKIAVRIILAMAVMARFLLWCLEKPISVPILEMTAAHGINYF